MAADGLEQTSEDGGALFQIWEKSEVDWNKLVGMGVYCSKYGRNQEKIGTDWQELERFVPNIEEIRRKLEQIFMF